MTVIRTAEKDMFGPVKPGQCPNKKMGEYNPMRCADVEGHAGDHCYYVSGQYPKDARK